MHPRGLKPDVSDTSVFLVLAHFHSVCILRHGIDHLTHTRFFLVKLLLVFLLQTILTRPVAMTMKALDDVFAACGVDPSISADLLTEGWTLSTFACCATSMADFETVLPDLCHNFPDITLLQKASLRAAFKSVSEFPDRSTAASQPSSSSGTGQTESGSWHESFAPKLESDVVQQLKVKFLSNYPSELLNADVMPSLRLLSLVHNQLKKQNWKWVPWRLRMSVSKAEELQSGRAQKIPKLEGLSLHSLLLDEPPSLDINNSTMGVNAVRNMLEIHDRAIAICGGAHLANLKAYSHKFLSFLTQRVDPETNLRNPNVIEAQHADQKIWGVISDLMSERGWGLDDALHELTHIRHDLPGLLQLRPRAARIPPPLPTSNPRRFDNPKGRGKGKNPKGSGKHKGKVQWVTEIKTKDGSWKSLCMRYQSGKCNLPNCSFVHGCAYPVEGGLACGMDHGAMMHRSTPH